jgi:outer membrane receptor protein involved in Fe transport
MYGRARVVEFEANPALVGNYLPQVPSHRGSVQLAWVDPRIAQVAIGLQAVGRQFDDDQNLRVVPGRSEPGLPGVVLVEVSASKRLTRRLQIFAGAQNLLDRVYYVGTLPTTLGTPRLVHGGLRIRLDGAR